MDTEEEMPFLLCPLNRYDEDLHLFRSPWSSKFFPEKNRGEDFKELFGEAYQTLSAFEKRANELYNFYAELYHGGEEGLATSVYALDFERDQFIECIFLLKKTHEKSKWSTVHHFRINFMGNRIQIICLSGVY